jgi:hypothetical protein
VPPCHILSQVPTSSRARLSAPTIVQALKAPPRGLAARRTEMRSGRCASPAVISQPALGAARVASRETDVRSYQLVDPGRLDQNSHTHEMPWLALREEFSRAQRPSYSRWIIIVLVRAP